MKILTLKSIAFLFVMMICGLTGFAQNTAGKQDDLGRVALNAYVPQQIENMPDAARAMLTNKLNQIVTQKGMGGSPESSSAMIGEETPENDSTSMPLS